MRFTGFRFVALCTIVVAVAISILTLIRWQNWNYGVDLGIFAQVVSNVPAGFTDRPELGTHFRYHFSPVLVLLWPWVAVLKNPLVLQFAAILLILATTPAVYVVFRRYASDSTATWIALCTLLNPFLYSQAFHEFHELVFFPVLLVGIFWAFDRERWWIAALLSLAAFCVREDVALITAFTLLAFCAVGLVALRRGTKARGLLWFEPGQPTTLAITSASLAAVGFVLVAAYFQWVRQDLGGWQPASFYQYAFATSPFAVLASLFTQPMVAWPALVSLGRAGYLFEAFLCTAFLAVRSRWAILTIPGFVVVLLANNMSVWRIGAHYALLWVPFAIIALGCAALTLDEAVRTRWLATCVGVLTILLFVGNPLHLGTYLRPGYHDLGDAQRALASVGNVALATHDEWQAQISVSDPLANAVQSRGALQEQWLIYANDYPIEQFQTTIKPELARMVARGTLRVKARYGNVVVYERVRP